MSSNCKGHSSSVRTMLQFTNLIYVFLSDFGTMNNNKGEVSVLTPTLAALLHKKTTVEEGMYNSSY